MRAGMWRRLFRGLGVLLFSSQILHTQDSAEIQPSSTTIHVSTQIVLLDVSIRDKRGHPVRSVLHREDFGITENGRPQKLLSFEPSAPSAAATKTIFVLDELNTGLADKAYYLVCFEQYLRSLPEILPAPAEFMVLTSSSLKTIQPPTQNRGELLSALRHLPTNGAVLVNLEAERFARTLNAVNLIALTNLGDPKRTAVLWFGPGDGIDFGSQLSLARPQTERFIRYMTNTLLESRTTLYVIFPPDFAGEPVGYSKARDAQAVSAADPYSGGFNFRTLAAQTGGSAYTATNDLVAATRSALDFGHDFYTLGYRPEVTVTDGRFRNIHVTLRDPNLRVTTKSGYYAPDLQEQDAPQMIQVFQMSEAGKSTLPFHSIPLRIHHITRTLNAKSVEFTIVAEGNHLSWQPDGQQQSLTELTIGGLSFSAENKKLSSSFRNVNMMARSQEASVLRETKPALKVLLDIPPNTDHVRLIVSSRKDGKLGCIDVPRSVIEAAPVTAGIVLEP